MELATLEMPVEEAKTAYQEYRHAKRSVRQAELNREDAEIARCYRELSKGKAVLDINQAFKDAGEDDRGLPRIAIARADDRRIRLRRDWAQGTFQMGPPDLLYHGNRRDGTYDGRRFQGAMSVRPRPVINGHEQWTATYEAIVPNIPPRFRPVAALSNYHILFDAEWRAVPVPPHDPALLKHLGGPLYAVLATWDLTPIERAVLGITRA